MPKKKAKTTTIDIALDILELYSPTQKQLGISEIASRLGRKISSVHRTLAILKNRGYMEQAVERGKYGLGLKVFELGCVYRNQTDLIREVGARLERLARATDETVNLAVLRAGGRDVTYVFKIDSPHVLRTDIQIGTKLWAHCTALGKVLLAALDRAELDVLYPPHSALEGYTERSLKDTDRLRVELERARREGFALDRGEFRREVVCVAMPLRDRDGRVAAAVSVSGPASRFSAEQVHKIKGIMFDVLGDSRPLNL
jgi:IclR family transcriptional regulator, KDG regulon repressor